MKKLLPLLLFCIGFIALSQDVKREIINGQIIVEGNDIEGITIYNVSSKIGTVSNENGMFVIAVALNDLLEFRALEYQNFDIKVNEDILASKTLRVYLIDEINKLDEVIVTRKSLTGNIAQDAKIANTFRQKLDVVYFGTKSNDELTTSDANGRQIENIALERQGQGLVNGLNVVNIVDQLLIPLFRSEVIDKEAAGVPEVPSESIKYYLGSNFLMENFDIPAYRVEEFIRYMEDATFDFNLLNYGNELELLQVVSEKSKEFLKNKK